MDRLQQRFLAPNGAKEFISKSGRKCYLSGVSKVDDKFIASIRFLDDGKFTDVDFDKIEKYLK